MQPSLPPPTITPLPFSSTFGTTRWPFPQSKGGPFQDSACVCVYGICLCGMCVCVAAVGTSIALESVFHGGGLQCPGLIPCLEQQDPSQLMHKHESRLGNHSGKEIQETSDKDSEERGRG